ncbi:MAG: LytTR family DNA-binding domain-containing protein [Oscillospiraceae bacterium]|nr:LytTR family DNA-binding domain-containing protein [Oscillospiraceae bacterium]
MLHVFICEDDLEQRTYMEKLVSKHIMETDYDMELALSADNPTDILDYLDQHPNQRGLYFLDVDLQHELNGIELGATIRKMDVSATIVFITTHSEMAHLVFIHKVEAMEYIIKDDPKTIETGVKECMQLAYQRYLNGKHSQNKYFSLKSGDQTWNILHDDILFFETDSDNRNKLILHTTNGLIGFRGVINEVKKIGPEFFCCHKANVVNVNKIKRVDRALRTIELVNGDTIPVAIQKMSELLRRLGE